MRGELCADAIRQHKSISCRAVMIGVGEAFIMKASAATRGDDDQLRVDNHQPRSIQKL